MTEAQSAQRMLDETSWEREERVLRILTRPERRDANTVEAEKQQRRRMARLWRTLRRDAPEETPVPEAKHEIGAAGGAP